VATAAATAAPTVGDADSATDAAIRGGFGLWKDAPGDGIAYQEEIRSEWTR
jgi:hypothetical protein